MKTSAAHRFLIIASAVALVGAMSAAVPASGASPALMQYATGRAGIAPRVAPQPITAVAGSVSAPPKGVRRIPRIHTSALPVGAPPTTETPAAAAATVINGFNGVSSRDSRVTNFNLEFEPPDQGLCMGNGFVLEAVNSAYRIYRPNGTSVRGPFNVNDLFNEGAAEFTTDPRCYFDPGTNTWFATILFIDFTTNESRIDLAVSTSGDPTGLWTQYRFDTTDDGRLGEPSNPGCPCLGDQPLFGIDQHNVYISTNEFSIIGPEFNGAQIYAVAKKDLLAGNPAAHFVHFGNLTIGGDLAASVQPASNRANVPAEFFLNSLDPTGTVDSRLGVWALTGAAKVATGGMPTLSSTVIASEAYGFPPPAAQKGSASLIDSGDDRMQQVQFIGGRLWGELTTSVTISGDTAERAGAAWFSVNPALTGGNLSGAKIDRQGYVVKKGSNLMYPALQADVAGRAAMVFTLTGATSFPSAAYATLGSGASSFSAPAVAAAGTGPYSRTSTRWGDYSYATLDPSGNTVWLATEYIPPKPSQTPDGRQNWGTRVLAVALR
jgi:hypothetical protein